MRGRGEGSIYQRKDGRWTGAITLGRGRRRTFYAGTRGEVQRLVRAALRNTDQGLPAAPAKLKLGGYLLGWLEQRSLTGKPLAPRTLESYGGYVRNHLVPGLGHLSLDRLTPSDVERFLGRKLAEGFSPQSVLHMRGILQRALKVAVRDQLVPRNVATLTDPPSVNRAEVRPLDPDEGRQLLAAARGHRLEALFITAITTGMRQGELLGLQWGDVDLDLGRVEVRRQLQRVGGQLKLRELKTKRSRRTIDLPRLTLDTLAGLRQAQAAAGRPPLPTGLVFVNLVGKPLEPRRVTKEFKDVLARASLRDTRFHDLRHSAASFLIAEHVDPRQVMEVLGHSSIKLTMDTYGHLFEKARKETAAAMDRVMGGYSTP